jgi:hypothetical protein
MASTMPTNTHSRIWRISTMTNARRATPSTVSVAMAARRMISVAGILTVFASPLSLICPP